MTMFCSKCGNKIKEGEIFCPKCGLKIDNNTEINCPDGASKLPDTDKEIFSVMPETETKTIRLKRVGVLGVLLVAIITISGLTVFYFDSKDKKVQKTVAKNENVTITKQTVESEKQSEEYILPHSDSEYLTDADVQNLSSQELALARNEIIARHGRIFQDEQYKVYFEEKNWYDGKIEPQKFDEQYDSILNDVEKKNIELIKKYEGLANVSNPDPLIVKGLAQEHYGDFLQYYKEQEANSFPRRDMELINQMFFDPVYFPNGYDMELYYTVIDLAADGVPELFISDKQKIYGAYCISETYGEVKKLLGNTGNQYLGDTVLCDICDNGMIKENQIINDTTNETTFYQMEKNSTELKLIEGASVNQGKYYNILSSGKEAKEISADRYNEILNQYPIKKNIEWYKLSEFENQSESQTNTTTDYKSAYLEFVKEESSLPLQMHYYFLHDIDTNGIPELIIAKGNTGDMMTSYIYSYDSTTETITLTGSLPTALPECYNTRNDVGVALLMYYAGNSAGVMLTLENNTLIQESISDNEEILYYRSQEAIPHYEINNYAPLTN